MEDEIKALNYKIKLGLGPLEPRKPTKVENLPHIQAEPDSDYQGPIEPEGTDETQS